MAPAHETAFKQLCLKEEILGALTTLTTHCLHSDFLLNAYS